MRFRRPCIRCGHLFTPAGKYSKICDNCKLDTYKLGGKLPKMVINALKNNKGGSKKMRFRRRCIRCGHLFTPTGKYSKICDNCKLDTYKLVGKLPKMVINALKNDNKTFK